MLATKTRLRPARLQMAHLPAPTGGINRIDAAGAMPAADAVLLYNLVAAEYGLRSRLGYHEWVTGMTGTNDNTVRTIAPFKGSKFNSSTDKLFATTDKGIWDVTSSTQTPTAPAGVTSFGTVNADSGWGSFVTAVDNSGNHNLLYCDEANGYFVYREATSDWLKPSQGTGATQVNNVDPATFVQACIYAHRIWFTQKDSTKAWYLGLFGGPAIYGNATAFDFGPYFAKGGTLVGLYNWTVDGSTGIVNRLVALSSGGDVVVFEGIDPSWMNSWSIVGVYNVGGLPFGRRVANDYGGDLLILSTLGVIPLSRLVNGAAIADRSQYATYKIANLFNAAMYSSSSLKGWSIRLHPQDNTLIITIPTASGQPTTQLAMALANRSWSQYRGLNMLCNEVLNGQMYFGTTDGRVCQHTDYIDGVLLSNTSAYTPIECLVLTAFQNLGTPRQKQVKLIRPRFLEQGVVPLVSVAAKYNFDLSELAQPSGSAGSPGGSVFDTARLDSATFTGDYAATITASGAAGMGTDVALTVAFKASSRTVLMGFDVAYEFGGFL